MHKTIIISRHAEIRAIQRGATREEIVQCIEQSEKRLVRSGRFSVKKTFSFESVSPANNKFYHYKTVETIFAEEEDKVAVVTVKVYYSNEEK